MIMAGGLPEPYGSGVRRDELAREGAELRERPARLESGRAQEEG